MILVIGAARPAPIVLVIGIAFVQLLTWLRLFVLYLALGGEPGVGLEIGPEDG